MACGGDPTTGHELLGEGLARLEFGRDAGRTEQQATGGGEGVGDAGGEGHLRPDHGEPGRLALGERQQRRRVGDLDRHVGGKPCGAWIAWRADEPVGVRVARERPRERVLAGAAPITRTRIGNGLRLLRRSRSEKCQGIPPGRRQSR